MAGNWDNRNPVAVSDLTDAIIDPVLRRRTGLSVALVQSWEEIVGPRLAASSRPERIRWPRRVGEDDPFEPAVLVIACSGVSALHLQHETAEVLSRVNAFLGYQAIGRIRIEQKPVADTSRKPALPPRSLTEPERTFLDRTVGAIEDDGLRASLERLGATILTRR
ncbi:MAG: DUF721 domain-containing protein [Rhizobiaceae bacterium]|nr:DUF721 domain-containing protein [Rhizobiaceae bacterium]